MNDVDVITINVIPTNSVSLWLDTDKIATVNGGTSWTDGEVINFAAPGLALEPGTTSGTFSSVFNLDAFAQDGDADLSGLHRVSRSVIVGTGGGSMNLQKGDILLSIEGSETLGGVSVTDQDLVLFRPTVLDDYSSGTFSIVINSPVGAKIREVALVEQNLALGGVALDAGDLLLVHGSGTYDKDVWRFQATTVGDGTTTGTFTELIDGDDIGLTEQIGGLALVESTTAIGNVTLNSGELLLNLRNSAAVGTNSLAVTEFDIFRLSVSQAGPTTIASASMLFEGADVGLSSGGEEFHGLALVATNYAPTLAGANSFTSIAEDDFTNSGTLVSALISGQVGDLDEGALSGIAVTAVDNTNGSWEYSTNSGASWSSLGSPTESIARLLGADASTLIRFIPNADHNGNVSITFRAWDQTDGTIGSVADATNNGGATAFSSSTANSTLTVTAVNDDPTNAGSLPSDISVTEDVSSDVDLSVINLSDVDHGGSNLTVTLSTSTGGNLGASSGGGVTVGGSGTGTLTLTGTLASLNTFLDSASNITYLHGTPGTTGNDADTINVVVNDNGNTGTGGGADQNLGTVNVDIGAVNDAPVNTVPGTQTVAEETPTAISGLSIADSDAGGSNLTTRLQVSNGVLNVTLSGAAGISAGSNDSGDLTIHGSVTDINASLASLTYTGNTDVVGIAADTLTVTTNDLGNTGSGGALQDVDNIQIDITAVNDTPVVSGPGSAYAATEQVGLAIEGTGFTVSDVDAAAGSMTATLVVGEGAVTVSVGDSGVSISSGNGTSTVTLTGTLSQLDNLLTGAGTGTITYLNSSDTPSASTTITVTVNDGGNTGADPGLTGDGSSEQDFATQTINITATNDDPTNAGSLPSDISVTEDVSSDLDLSVINLSDVDHGGSNLSVTLATSTGGNLSASSGWRRNRWRFRHRHADLDRHAGQLEHVPGYG